MIKEQLEYLHLLGVARTKVKLTLQSKAKEQILLIKDLVHMEWFDSLSDYMEDVIEEDFVQYESNSNFSKGNVYERLEEFYDFLNVDESNRITDENEFLYPVIVVEDTEIVGDEGSKQHLITVNEQFTEDTFLKAINDVLKEHEGKYNVVEIVKDPIYFEGVE